MEDLLELLARSIGLVVRPVRRRLSRVRIVEDEVRVRNLPLRTVRLPVDRVDRFDWSQTEDGPTGVLHRNDGSPLRVEALDDSRPGAVTALNNKLLATRRASLD